MTRPIKITKFKFKPSILIGHFSRYTIADVFPKILQLLLIPIYSRLIESDSYGLLQLGLTVNVLLPVILSLSQEKILYKNYSREAKDADIIFGRVFNGILLSSLILSIPVFILIYEYFKSIYLALLIVFSSVSIALSTPVTTKLVLDENSHSLSKYILLDSFLFNLSLLLLAYYMPERIEWVFLFKGGFWLTVVLNNCPKNLKLTLQFDTKILKWSFPLLIVSAGAWIMGYFDRVMLKNIVGLSMVASYSIVYRYAEILTFISSVYNKTIEARINSYIKNDSEKQFFLLAVYIIILIVAGGALYFLKDLFKTLINPQYNLNFDILGYIMIGIILYQVSGWLNRYFYHWDLNWYLTGVTIMGALIAFLSLTYLIPLYGVIGAAISTCITYSALSLLKVLVILIFKR